MLTYLTNNLGIEKNAPGPRQGHKAKFLHWAKELGLQAWPKFDFQNPHKIKEGTDSSRLSSDLHMYALDTGTHIHVSCIQMLKKK